MRDEDGKWFYFRFWECKPAKEYFTNVAADASKSQLWFPQDIKIMAVIIILPISGIASVFHTATEDAEHVSKARYYLSRQEKRMLSKQREVDFHTRLISHLEGMSQSFLQREYAQKVQFINGLTLTAARHKIKIEKAVADFAAAAVLLKDPVETYPEYLAILRSKKFGQVKKAQKLLEAVRKRK